MRIYIDCSGDEGFKLGKSRGERSSSYYVCAGLVFAEADAGASIGRIQRLHEVLGLPGNGEIKFSELKHDKRMAFFGMLGCCDVNVYALTVAKDDIGSTRLTGSGIEFRREFCMQLLRRGVWHAGLQAMIDDMEGNDAQRAEFREYVMEKVNRDAPGKLASVALVKSHQFQLVQAADMCAGAIRYACEEGKEEYRRLFSDKIKNDWQFK